MKIIKAYGNLIRAKENKKMELAEAMANQDLFTAIQIKLEINKIDDVIAEFKRKHKIDCFDICKILKKTDGQDWTIRVLREIKREDQNTFYTGKYTICYAHKTEIEHLDANRVYGVDVELEDWEYKNAIEKLKLLIAKTDNSKKSFEFHPLERFSEQNFFDVALGNRNKVCNPEFVGFICPKLYEELTNGAVENNETYVDVLSTVNA